MGQHSPRAQTAQPAGGVSPKNKATFQNKIVWLEGSCHSYAVTLQALTIRCSTSRSLKATGLQTQLRETNWSKKSRCVAITQFCIFTLVSKDYRLLTWLFCFWILIPTSTSVFLLQWWAPSIFWRIILVVSKAGCQQVAPLYLQVRGWNAAVIPVHPLKKTLQRYPNGPFAFQNPSCILDVFKSLCSMWQEWTSAGRFIQFVSYPFLESLGVLKKYHMSMYHSFYIYPPNWEPTKEKPGYFLTLVCSSASAGRSIQSHRFSFWSRKMGQDVKKGSMSKVKCFLTTSYMRSCDDNGNHGKFDETCFLTQHTVLNACTHTSLHHS